MKREDWQRVYAPRGDALDIRVRNTLATLTDRPAARVAPRRALALALAAALLLTSAVAVAAGLLRSRKVDAKLVAAQAMQEQYGFTRDMESFFFIQVSEEGGKTVVTYEPVDFYGDRTGTYTVVIENGKAEASWSFDGEEIGEGLHSPIWGVAQLAEGIERKKNGEEWYQMTAEEELAQPTLSEEEALELAKAAIAAKYGEQALTQEYTKVDIHAMTAPATDMKPGVRMTLVKPNGEDTATFWVELDGLTGETLRCDWTVAPWERTLPEGDLSGYADAVEQFVKKGAMDALDAAARYETAQRIREAGLAELLDDDYADPALAAIGEEQGKAAVFAALEEKYGLSEALRGLFAEHFALVNEGDAAVYKLVLTPELPYEDAEFMRESPDGDYSEWEQGFGKHADRMGEYEAAIDANTGDVIRASWTLDGAEMGNWAENTWGQSEAYDADCLRFLNEVLTARAAIREQYADVHETRYYVPEEDAALDALMVNAGFSAARYNHVLPARGELSEEQAIAAAKDMLMAQWGLTQADFTIMEGEKEAEVECRRENDKTVWSVLLLADGQYWVDVNAADGTIEDVIYDNGAAGNG